VPSEQHQPIFAWSHFVASVPPRFTNFLASEIRAKTFDGGIVRTEGKPGTIAGLLFRTLLTGSSLLEARQSVSSPGVLSRSHRTPEARCSPGFLFYGSICRPAWAYRLPPFRKRISVPAITITAATFAAITITSAARIKCSMSPPNQFGPGCGTSDEAIMYAGLLLGAHKRNPGDGGEHRGFGFRLGGTSDGEGNPSRGYINASASRLFRIALGIFRGFPSAFLKFKAVRRR
jgi:hypothetical protein